MAALIADSTAIAQQCTRSRAHSCVLKYWIVGWASGVLHTVRSGPAGDAAMAVCGCGKQRPSGLLVRRRRIRRPRANRDDGGQERPAGMAGRNGQERPGRAASTRRGGSGARSGKRASHTADRLEAGTTGTPAATQKGRSQAGGGH